jgi:hypothetical protein
MIKNSKSRNRVRLFRILDKDFADELICRISYLIISFLVIVFPSAVKPLKI